MTQDNQQPLNELGTTAALLKTLGYNSEQIKMLAEMKPNPNIKICGYTSTFKSPLLKNLLNDREKSN
jgi:hypothetical protein